MFSEITTMSDTAVVLGTAQDGGVPQAGCGCGMCERARGAAGFVRRPSCLGLIDGETGSRWIIDATPQFPSQLSDLSRINEGTESGPPEGILLTHAHVGHYAGLLHLGQEVMCSHEVPVWVMPRMAEFLEKHEPWASLVARRHVILKELSPKCPVTLGERITVRPLPVWHRDELSETVAFEIAGDSRRVLWLPDIDGWEGRLTDWVAGMDVAWLDGTFYSDSELPGRQLDQIPHPRISEHLAEYGTLAKESGVDVRLIHLNHSNPVCDPDTPEAHRIVDAGVRVASEGERVEL